MAVIEHHSSGLNVVDGAAFVSVRPTGEHYSIAAQSGTIAAALAANSSVFAMRLDPGTTKVAYIERLKIQFTTIVAFTTPVTAGRRLALFRGSGAATSGGTAAPAVSKGTTSPPSEFLIAQGGDSRISSTGALTVTGITFETDPLAVFSLTHVGAAGAFSEWVWDANQHTPIILQPGQLLAVRAPVAMDAAGTWQFSITADYYELGST